MTEDLATSLADLPSLAREQLINRWRDLFKQSPPANLSVQLMRSAIAYELQAGAGGGLSKRARDELRRVAISPAARPARQPRSGAQLVREWNGVPHIVDIVEDGYVYRGQAYASLTAIAFEITGARWSGPRFFGLKQRTSR